MRPWFYVEYNTGQYITAHIDRVAPSPTTTPRQLAGVSVLLNDDFEGGPFFVETAGSDALWSEDAVGDLTFVHEGADLSAPWFTAVPRTRWLTAPAAGTALLYGSQLIHGTLPVTRGTVRKLISWFACP